MGAIEDEVCENWTGVANQIAAGLAEGEDASKNIGKDCWLQRRVAEPAGTSHSSAVAGARESAVAAN